MKEKTVIIEIDEQGNSTIDLDGFHGKGEHGSWSFLHVPWPTRL